MTRAISRPPDGGARVAIQPWAPNRARLSAEPRRPRRPLAGLGALLIMIGIYISVSAITSASVLVLPVLARIKLDPNPGRPATTVITWSVPARRDQPGACHPAAHERPHLRGPSGSGGRLASRAGKTTTPGPSGGGLVLTLASSWTLRRAAGVRVRCPSGRRWTQPEVSRSRSASVMVGRRAAARRPTASCETTRGSAIPSGVTRPQRSASSHRVSSTRSAARGR